MATRLLLVAHAPTTATHQLCFPAHEDAVDPANLPERIRRTVRSAECGHEDAAVRTAEALGINAASRYAWNGRDHGAWSGLRLADLDESTIARWVAAPNEAPPEGETVDDVVRRIAERLDEGFGDGIQLVVTSADVLRAMVLLVTGAPATSYAAVDVAPLDALEVTINGVRRAIRSLRPYPDWL